MASNTKYFRNEFNLNENQTRPFNKDSSIVVIGAGPAGVHMASMLKKLGHTNVIILEKDRRIGGKSKSIHISGVPYEMGTCFLTTQYKEIKKLISEYLSEEAIMPPNGYTGDKNVFTVEGQKVPLKMGEFISGMVDKSLVPEFLLDILQDKYNLMSVIMAIRTYLRVHREIFGDFKYGLPPCPTEEALTRINKTYLQFLQDNDCVALAPIVRLVMSGQGYGLDEIPALYGLWWITPGVLEDFLKEKSGGPRVVNVFKTGFQTLWEEIAKKDGLNIKFGTQIKKVNRNLQNPKEKVVITALNDKGEEVTYKCDFLMVACPLQFSLQFIEDTTPVEKELIGSIESFTVLTTLTEGPVRTAESEPYGITYYYHRLTKGDTGRLYGESNNRNIYNIPDQDGKRYSVIYQMDLQYAPEKAEEYRKKLWDDLKLLGETESTTKIIDHNHWYYFPHFSQESINKLYPWKLLESQGLSKTWYIGSSACFESVEDVVSYNCLLRDLFLQEPIRSKY